MTQITKDMVIADLLKTDIAEDAVPLLKSIGMHCLGCVMASSETIEQACQGHNVDADEIVRKLTALIKQ
jgi:hybrid cluster-associated redox disulfide protein